ncbi:MAG: nucleotidyltransferase domain-containing protein [Nitrospirae bacterium]|nr:nucleotidyltransferase domain-containing protein [Nitrospirota bacterium]
MSKAKVLREIDKIKKSIVEKYSPEKIILFGSYAYGRPDRESDVDFLVVMPFSGKAVYKTVEILESVRPSIPVDLIVRTPRQVEKRLAQNDFFLREIFKRGKVLYEAPH